MRLAFDIMRRRGTTGARVVAQTPGADDEEASPLAPMQQQQQQQQQQQLLRKPPPGAVAPPCGACGAAPGWREEIAARCRPGLAWAIAFVYVGWPFLRHYNLVPTLVWRLVMAAGVGALGHRLLTFRRWGDEHRYVGRFAACFVVMIAELLFENCMVWIVSATDMRKYEEVPGLQDNAEIAFRWLAGRGRLLEWGLYGDWVHTKEFLGAALVVAFSVAWDQIPYSGFGIMARFTLSIAAGRLIRVACFMTTILPNPRPGCYRRRFPPPPDSAWEALRVGFTTLRGSGGCNDLIFSGHGAFWTLTPLIISSYYPKHRAVVALVWAALVQTSIRDFLEQMHYSVDMLLAVVVTAAVWGWLRAAYPESDPLPRRPEGAAADPSHPLVLALVAMGLLTAAVVILVAKA